MLRVGREGDKRITGAVCGFKNRGGSALLPCSLPWESASCPVLLEHRRTGIGHSHGVPGQRGLRHKSGGGTLDGLWVR